MNLSTTITNTRDFLRPAVLILALALIACSHDKTTVTESVKAQPPTTIAAVKKPELPIPEATKPARSEPTKPEPSIAKPAANETAANDLFVLKPGQSKTIDTSTSLQYVRLVSDSRCPVGVQCIWAGEATIELKLKLGKEEQIFTLTDRENKKSLMGFDIELISIDRSHMINVRARKI